MFTILVLTILIVNHNIDDRSLSNQSMVTFLMVDTSINGGWTKLW